MTNTSPRPCDTNPQYLERVFLTLRWAHYHIEEGEHSTGALVDALDDANVAVVDHLPEYYAFTGSAYDNLITMYAAGAAEEVHAALHGKYPDDLDGDHVRIDLEDWDHEASREAVNDAIAEAMGVVKAKWENCLLPDVA